MGGFFQWREMSMETFWMKPSVKCVMETLLLCLYQTAVETGTYQYHTVETLIHPAVSYRFTIKKLTKVSDIVPLRNYTIWNSKLTQLHCSLTDWNMNISYLQH